MSADGNLMAAVVSDYLITVIDDLGKVSARLLMMNECDLREEAILHLTEALKGLHVLPMMAAADIDSFPSDNANETHKKSDPRIRRVVYSMTGGKCAYCGVHVTLEFEEGKQSMCVEHVVPESKGGPNCLHNYVPACGPCNTGKRDHHVLYFIRRKFGVAA